LVSATVRPQGFTTLNEARRLRDGGGCRMHRESASPTGHRTV